jgi:hypothetical protein
MIAIAAGEPYVIFNQTQCTVSFVPTEFDVSVNTTEQSISVTSISNTKEISDIEPTSRLSSDVMWSLNLLSRMTPSLYESTLANTLLQNVAMMRSRHATHSFKASTPPDETELTLRSVEESFTAMIDDILVAYSAAQLVLSNSSVPATISAQMPALQIGSMKYIFWGWILNLALLTCVLEEAWRTKGGRNCRISIIWTSEVSCSVRSGKDEGWRWR